MTPTSPGPSHRARRLRFGAAAVAAVLAGSIASPAAAETDDEEEAVPASMHVAIAEDGVLPLAGDVAIRTDLIAGSEDLPAGTLDVDLGTRALSDSDALESWLTSGTAHGSFEPLADETIDALNAESGTTVEQEVDDLEDRDPGVYPLRAEYQSDDDSTSISAMSVAVVPDADAGDVAVLLPITAAPEDGGLLDADELAELTAADGALTADLDAATDTDAILAVDPAILAAIRVLGSSAPEDATNWLQRLDEMSNPRFALLPGDADATVQMHAGFDDLLTIDDLDALVEPEAEPTPTPSDTPSFADANGEDDADDLLSVTRATPDILWPRADVSAKDLDAFAKTIGDDTMTILPDSVATGADSSAGEVDGHPLIVTNDAASSRLSAAVEGRSATGVNDDLAAAMGHLFFASRHASLTVVGLDRSQTRDPDALRTVLEDVANSTATLTGMRSAPADPVKLGAKADKDRVAALKTLLGDEDDLDEFSSILDTPALLLAPERLRILQTTGVGVDEDELPDALAAHRERTRTTLDAVGLQKPNPVQLFTDAAPLPVWVRNDLPWPVNVTLTTQPSDPRLGVQTVTEVNARESSNTRVTVPIEARVASGELRVDFQLSSRTGITIGSPATADVTVRAAWESIGLVVLGALIVLLIGFGVLRTVLRRRRRAESAETDDPTSTDGEPETDAETATDHETAPKNPDTEENNS